jgi:DNA-binding transcriptional ArsR family regulator
MVVDTDGVFQALADATRRDILTRVIRSGQSVSELARAYPMSFAAVQKHVAVLERAGLVSKTRRGREQIVHGEVEALRRVTRLLDGYEQLWRQRAAGIQNILDEEPDSLGKNPDILDEDPGHTDERDEQ